MFCDAGKVCVRLDKERCAFAVLRGVAYLPMSVNCDV